MNNLFKGRLFESDQLVQQVMCNYKGYANSPDLCSELLNAIMDALTAQDTMSKQALDSERERTGLKPILLGPAGLYEALRPRGSGSSAGAGV